MNDSEQINTEVLQQWITGRGKQPVTWKTLAQVLKDLDLSRLAGEIEDAKSHENTQENSTDNSINKDQSGMPTGSSNQSNTRDVLSRCTKNGTHCETLEQFNNNLLATNLLSVDDPPDERVQRDTTAEITEGSSQRNIGVIPINDTEIENDSRFEAMQVADIVCRGIQQSKEENRRSNIFYADFEDPPVERVQRDVNAEINGEIEQRSIADVPSSDTEDASPYEEEKNQRSSIFHEGNEDPPVERVQRHVHVTTECSYQRNSGDVPASSIYNDKDYEHIQQIADFVCKCVQQLKEKEKSQRNVPPGDTEEPPAQEVLRNTAAEVTKGSEQRRIQDPHGSCIEDNEYYKAIEQIAAIAAGLPSRCSELLETSHQENEQNPTTNAPCEIGDRQPNIALTSDEVLD